MRLLFLILLVSACASGDRPPENTVAPFGYLTASLDATCIQSAACICSIPGVKGKVLVQTPKELLEKFPSLPAYREDYCDEN